MHAKFQLNIGYYVCLFNDIIGVRDAETKAKERILDNVTLEDDEDAATATSDLDHGTKTPCHSSKKRKVDPTVSHQIMFKPLL